MEKTNQEQPYIETTKLVQITKRQYNPKYGDDRLCKCGHPYYRHFDSYEDMDPIGCKYCDCGTFKEMGSGINPEATGEVPTIEERFRTIKESFAPVEWFRQFSLSLTDDELITFFHEMESRRETRVYPDGLVKRIHRTLAETINYTGFFETVLLDLYHEIARRMIHESNSKFTVIVDDDNTDGDGGDCSTLEERLRSIIQPEVIPERLEDILNTLTSDELTSLFREMAINRETGHYPDGVVLAIHRVLRDLTPYEASVSELEVNLFVEIVRQMICNSDERFTIVVFDEPGVDKDVQLSLEERLCPVIQSQDTLERFAKIFSVLTTDELFTLFEDIDIKCETGEYPNGVAKSILNMLRDAEPHADFTKGLEINIFYELAQQVIHNPNSRFRIMIESVDEIGSEH